METRDLINPALGHLAAGDSGAVADLERETGLQGGMLTLATGHTRLRYVLVVGNLGQ